MLARARTALPPLSGPLAVFLLGAALAALAAYRPSASAPWLASLIAGAALYAAVTILGRDLVGLRQAASALAAAGGAAALFFALQYRHLGWPEKLGAATALGRATSALLPALSPPWLTANVAAGVLEGALPVAVGLALSARGRARWGWWACAGLIGYALLLTVSRGAWVALLVAGLLGGLAALRPRAGGWLHISRPALVGAAAALALALAAGAAALLVPGALGSAEARAADRGELYRNSLYLAVDSAFTGVGGGEAFPMTYSRLQLLIGVPYLTYAHQLPLAVWLGHGLIGLAGFCALTLAAGRLFVRAVAAPGGRAGPVAVGAMLASLADLLHGLTDAPAYDQWPAMLMAFAALGVAVAGARLADPRPLRWLRPGRRGYAALGALLLAAALIFGRGLGALAAANAAELAALRAQQGTPPEDQAGRAALLAAAQRWVELGERIDPSSAAVLKQRGMLALADGRYGEAIVALRRAAPSYPDDQSVRKALAYAYIWYGYTDEGAALLRTLDRAAEARGELDSWQAAWSERGRPDLADRARQAAAAFDRG